MSMLRSTVLLIETLCFLSFISGVRWHFVQHGKVPAGMRVLSLLTLLGFSWIVYSHLEATETPTGHGTPADEAAQLTAFLMSVASLFLFWWTVAATRSRPPTLAFTSDIPVHIHTEGPYAYVRHPFYSSYVLFWISSALSGGNFIGYALPIVMAVLYCVAARREEQKFAASDLAASYAKYREKTGMLMPAFWHRAGT